MAYGTNSNGGYSGTIIASPIRPADPLQTIATVFSNEVKGSLHTYQDITERDALMSVRRDWGMLCYVVSVNRTYQLTYGYNSTTITDNGNWVEFTGSAGGGSVIHLDAYTSDGHGYTASATNTLTSYSLDALYVVNFTSSNMGGSVSLDIDSLGERVIKKTDGVSLTNIVSSELTTNYQYLVTYNGTEFELLNPSSGGGSGLSNKYYISSTETVTVPPSNQYWIYGDLTIDGTLDNYGQVIVVNGSLNVNSGYFNDYGTYSNKYFAEIDGLGQYNYVPRWLTPYMLTATSSIYDDSNEVVISSPTFSVLSDIVLPNGASAGYVLTSDANGVATWQQSSGALKYSTTLTFTSHITQSISHNLNTNNIVFDFWNEDTGYREYPDVVKTSVNTIDVMSTTTIMNGRVVIIS